MGFKRWVLGVLLVLCGLAQAADLDEFKSKREERFEFTTPPQLTRDGDRIEIRFESKGFCDATVAIENTEGKIVRHLASGVLGPKAPEPFLKNSLKQTVVWDGKDDQGKYLDDKDRLTVRVSLGLKPLFERTLFWSPQKRIGSMYPIIRAAAEGVYVYEGDCVNHLRLFDHAGNYLRTVYPFPADKTDKVDGLNMFTYRDGRTVPLKGGYHQATLLTSGLHAPVGENGAAEVHAAEAMTVNEDKLALVNEKLNRLASDGSTGGMKLEGPKTWIKMPKGSTGFTSDQMIAPRSLALSPDNQWLYLAGHLFCGSIWWDFGWLNGVARMPYQGESEPVAFVGNLIPGDNGGTEPGKFRGAVCVACDRKGRVYVGDYMNDRVQVFDAEGKFLKAIPAAKPAQINVHPKTGEIYVFSWWMAANRWMTDFNTAGPKILPTMTHFGSFDDPKFIKQYALPFQGFYGQNNYLTGTQHRVEFDAWAEKPTVWIVNGFAGPNADKSFHSQIDPWDLAGVEIFEESDGKLVPQRKFKDDLKKSVLRGKPPILWRQRLYTNPVNGRLYVAECDSGAMKSFKQLLEIEPVSGTLKAVELPFDAEDICFDLDGSIYLRTDTVVARYDPETWREIPWDYGEDRDNVGFGAECGEGGRGAPLISGLPTPGHRSWNFWHLGGMDVSSKGHLVITSCNGLRPADRNDESPNFKYEGKKYSPKVYPGRNTWGEIHIWDKHGKLVVEDAAPGMAHLNGIGIDKDDNLYLLSASRRLVDGLPLESKLPRDATGTLIKVQPGKARMLDKGGAGIPVLLDAAATPKRPPDLAGWNSGWVENAEWLFGGIGFSTPFGSMGGNCVCWNTRFDLDYFQRSFAPEPQACSVAVIDGAGNLIVRIGRYGNVDDGRPLVAQGGPALTRPMGGDETALVYACYVATHTDRRLFIADAGNARIVSVKLGYHAEKKVPLREIEKP